MACGSCGTGSSGCSGGTCSTGGCGTMNVHDWLSGIVMPGEEKFDVVEVKFKAGRKEYYRNVNNLNLHAGDPVVIEASPGHHVGFVSAQGELVRLQMKKKDVKYTDELHIIYRIANVKDIEKYEASKIRELPTLYKTRQIINELSLDMKLTDIEYQADNTKATFFYSAEDRVDFRELIKRLASEFKIRVEMRQISLRQEAGRLGGIGSCGRELCCSTWLTEFKSVNTSAARYQNLSLNPLKLSGQCGRLKCCLNYELETYMEALEFIPELNSPLKTKKGNADLQKTDIFKKLMWFSMEGDSNWYKVPVERVNEILKMNSKGIIPFSLTQNQADAKPHISSHKELSKLDKQLSAGKTRDTEDEPRKSNHFKRRNNRKKP